jgi:hypothetical protein
VTEETYNFSTMLVRLQAGLVSQRYILPHGWGIKSFAKVKPMPGYLKNDHGMTNVIANPIIPNVLRKSKNSCANDVFTGGVASVTESVFAHSIIMAADR